MHRHITHNRCYAMFADFTDAILRFLRPQLSHPIQAATSLT
jgi:hypothetical protein